MPRCQWLSCKSTRRRQTRVSCCEQRSQLRCPLFSRLVKQNQFIFTRPIPTPLQPTSRRHSTQNRKKRSSSSSVRTGTSSHGSLLTCLEFPEDWLSTDYESTQSSSPLRNIFDGPPSRRERPLARKWPDY